MVGNAVREDGNVWEKANGPMESQLLVVSRCKEARPEILVVHRNVHESVRDTRLDYTVLDNGLGRPTDGPTFAVSTLDGGPNNMFSTDDFCCLDNVLALKLFRIVTMFIELCNAINSPCPRKRFHGFFQGAQIGFYDFNTLSSKSKRRRRTGVSSHAANFEGAARFCEKEIDNGAALPIQESNVQHRKTCIECC